MKMSHVGLYVLILEVERMLPDVNADDGQVREKRVLVRGRSDLELLGSLVQTLQNNQLRKLIRKSSSNGVRASPSQTPEWRVSPR